MTSDNKMMEKKKQDTIKVKLISHGTEYLAKALIDLASRNEDAARSIGRLISAPADDIAPLSAKLSAIRRSRRFIEYRESATFANDLTTLLQDLKTNISDPRTGLELLSSFFECDRSIFKRSDDSDGIIGDVFRFDVCDLFVEGKCGKAMWGLMVQVCEV